LGVGHYTGSFLPGQGGNILIAGHRTKAKFLNFKNLKIGDLVDFETSYGQYYYKVKAFKIIKGDDQSIADDTEAEQLTLYTCYPFYYKGTATKRFVVICSVQAKPATPGNLTVQNLSATSKRISWTAVEKSFKYEVYRATSIDGKYTNVSTRSSTTYINKNLKPGIIYYYKVRAFQIVGQYRVYGDFTAPM
jgi:LPXTG-site transpeptidase (sortase) family protein